MVFEIWAEELPGVIGVVFVGVGVLGEVRAIGNDFEGGFFGGEERRDGWGEEGCGGLGRVGFFAGDSGCECGVIEFDLWIEEFDGDGAVLAGPFEVD